MHNLLAALRATPPQSLDELAQILSTQLAAQVVIWCQTAASTAVPLTQQDLPEQAPGALPAASDQPATCELAQLGSSTVVPINLSPAHWVSITPPPEDADLALLQGLLEGWVGRITAEQVYEDLHQQHQDHDETIGLIAHDLKNPLTTIRGSAELLLRRATNEGRAERDIRRLEIIMDQCDRMRDFLGTLVNMARLKSGELPLEKQALNLTELIEGVVQALNTAMEQPRIEFSDTQPAYVLADRAWMEQAITNLLDNALKYSPADSTVTIHIKPGPQEVAVDVCDEGIGIEAADLERIFQRFARGKQSSRTVSGNGLGLYTVQTVISAHQGTIKATSPGLNQGCTFTLRLPTQTASPPETTQGGDDEQ